MHAPLAHLYGVQSCEVPSTLMLVWSSAHVAFLLMHVWVGRSQTLPVAQSLLCAQAALHEPAPQAYAPHDNAVRAAQVPLPSQTASPVSTPLMQPPAGPQ